jgi:phosphatidylserine/phosphatidylglycerophosphate/cardiolipin synthase-like enzyme
MLMNFMVKSSRRFVNTGTSIETDRNNSRDMSLRVIDAILAAFQRMFNNTYKSASQYSRKLHTHLSKDVAEFITLNKCPLTIWTIILLTLILCLTIRRKCIYISVVSSDAKCYKLYLWTTIFANMDNMKQRVDKKFNKVHIVKFDTTYNANGLTELTSNRIIPVAPFGSFKAFEQTNIKKGSLQIIYICEDSKKKLRNTRMFGMRNDPIPKQINFDMKVDTTPRNTFHEGFDEIKEKKK